MTKKLISLILSAIIAISMVSVTAFSASAATQNDTLTVKATSNYFPEATQVYNAETNEVTVNYNFKSSKDMLNLQWYLTYDKNVLSLSSKNTYSTITPNIGVNGVYNLDENKTGKVLANATSLSLYNFSKEVTPLVSLIFDVNKDYVAANKPVSTEVKLTVQYLGVSALGLDGMSDDAQEVYLVDNDGVVQTGPAVDAVTTVRKTELSQPAYLKGDVDGNEKVEVSDATLVQKYSAHKTSLSSVQLTAADVNNDGKYNVVDATLIQKYVSKKIISF